jgi:MOB kinase activator 1
MEWIESQLDDETVRARETRGSPASDCALSRASVQIFPQRPDQPFPRTFQDTVRTIFKRLFRVFAHIYHSHWDVTVSLGAEAHLNTCFKHFMYFTHAFTLIDKKELAPLAGASPALSAGLSSVLTPARLRADLVESLHL